MWYNKKRERLIGVLLGKDLKKNYLLTLWSGVVVFLCLFLLCLFLLFLVVFVSFNNLLIASNKKATAIINSVMFSIFAIKNWKDIICNTNIKQYKALFTSLGHLRLKLFRSLQPF